MIVSSKVVLEVNSIAEIPFPIKETVAATPPTIHPNPGINNAKAARPNVARLKTVLRAN